MLDELGDALVRPVGEAATRALLERPFPRVVAELLRPIVEQQLLLAFFLACQALPAFRGKVYDALLAPPARSMRSSSFASPTSRLNLPSPAR